ncbi:MAG: hypothetical protein ACRD1T_22135, partial [Acidimicrobiia bacterium]
SVGQLERARELRRQAVELARQRNSKEVASNAVGRAALAEALFGNARQARDRADAALTLERGRTALMLASISLALSSAARSAQALIDELQTRFPTNTGVQVLWLPTARAVFELDQGNASGALELLKVAAPYELGREKIADAPPLLPIYVRGLAYLKAGAGKEAAAEFQKILKNKGVGSLSPVYPLAHLGLARAARISGDEAASRKAYQDFLALWKDADPDIPIFQQAKQEYKAGSDPDF